MSRVHTYRLRRGIIYLYEDDDDDWRLRDLEKTIRVNTDNDETQHD